MGRPRFLADNDLKDAIIRGVRRRESAVEFVPLRDLGLELRSDAVILEVCQNLVVVHRAPIRMQLASTLV